MANTKNSTFEEAQERLVKISQLRAGWLDHDEPVPDPHAVEEMRKLLKLLESQTTIPAPNLYPLASGGVTCEWDKDDWSISASIEPTGTMIEINAINLETTQIIDLDMDQSDQQMAAQLTSLWNQTEGPSRKQKQQRIFQIPLN